MRVTVKQIDINRGTEGDSTNCPITRALRRTLGYPDHIVAVGLVDWVRDEDDSETLIPLPKRAIEFIKDFDDYGSQAVAPFSFITRRPA